ncbi:MAG: hypothetical protein DMG79_05585, partial [Acidobacteria bacterium]
MGVNSVTVVRVRSRRIILGSVLILVATCLAVFGQAQQSPVWSSELARQNMAHVGASVGQLIAVLHR